MPKVRYTRGEGHHVVPPMRFRHGERVEGGRRMIEVDPDTGVDLTPERKQELSALRKEQAYTSYHVEFWTQPLWNYVVYRLYHFYDMHIFKVPGMRTLAKVADWWLFRKAEGKDFMAMPWCAEQDLRCFELSKRGRVSVGEVDIDKETYDKLRKARNNEDW
jgi:hypothetical protein